MTKELVLSTKDLTDVGISSQLTSNDLLEVVANDIFEKFMAEIGDCVKQEKVLKEKVQSVMQPEYDEMKLELVKAKHIKPNEQLNMCYSKLNGDDWASCLYGVGFNIYEKEKGTKIERDNDAISLYYPKGTEAKVKIKMTNDEREDNTNSKVKDITCKIIVSTRKEFEKVITISTERFKKLISEIKEYNKRIEGVWELMPANGLLSVERFTREARVKMNKKIISAQSPDFRQKISQLFNIKL